MKRFQLVFAILLLASSLAFAAVGTTRITTTINTVPAISPALSIAPVNSSPSLAINPSFLRTDLLSIKGEIVSPALILALESGPYAYAVSNGNVLVIDTTKREVVSTIKPEGKDVHADAVAVSPDGKYIYMAISWAVYQDDYYGGHYDRYARVARLNASSQMAIDYFHFDDVRPEHLAVSPDGKVYLGFQLAYYPDSAGVKIMDFSQGKSWFLDYKNAFMPMNFEFDSSGKNVYYAGWWDYPRVYRLNWDTNKVSNYLMPGNDSNSYEYVRSIATAKGGTMLYTAVNRNKGIVATNTQDGGMKIITADYVPVSLSASKDGETLYAIGYIYGSDNKPVYFIHKYRGLKVIGPPYDGLFGWLLTTNEAFQYDSMSYITPPSGNYPSNMEVSADGRWGYITTSVGDGASYGYGDAMIVYDLEYMNQVKIIQKEKVRYGIAISPEEIYYSPAPDLSWASEFAASTLHGSFSLLDGSLMVKKFYPENGTFAKQYKEDFFVLYADFTDYIDNATLSNSTFRLTEKSGVILPGRTTAAGKIAIFTPASQLKASTDYVAHLSKAIKSKAGKPLYADVQWSFTTKNISAMARASPNSTLNFSYAKGLTLVGAGKFTLPVEAENSSKQNRSREWLAEKGTPLASRMPGSLSDWAKKGTVFGQGNTTGMQEGLNGTIDNEIGEAQGYVDGLDDETGSSDIDSESHNELGERVEIRDERYEIDDGNGSGASGNGSNTGGAGTGTGTDVKKSIEDAKKATQLNPQPSPAASAGGEQSNRSSTQEPPAPQKGIFEAIAEFFAGLFGMK